MGIRIKHSELYYMKKLASLFVKEHRFKGWPDERIRQRGMNLEYTEEILRYIEDNPAEKEECE